MLYNALDDFIRERQRDGFHEIKTPLLYNKGLWEMSGHWGKYRENMFLVLDNETGEHDFSLKPMNCPSHYLLYSVEEALVPRAAAALRHVRRAASQRGDGRALRAHARAAVPAGRLPRLPARGSDRGRGAVPAATSSSATTRRSASTATLKFATRPEVRIGGDEHVGSRRGGAARRARGDGHASTSSRRATARSTAPRSTSTSPTRSAGAGSSARFSSTTTRPSASSSRTSARTTPTHRPVVIHRAVSGSLERFIAILIEHFAGAFPVWLAPEQVRVIPITDAQTECGASAHRRGSRPPASARTSTTGSETLNYRIREGEVGRCRTWPSWASARRSSDSLALRARGAGKKQEVIAADAFLERDRRRGPDPRARSPEPVGADARLEPVGGRIILPPADHRNRSGTRERQHHPRHCVRRAHAHRALSRRPVRHLPRRNWARWSSARRSARAGIDAGAVEEVIMGQVVQGGSGQAPARQALIHAGIPAAIPALTINKVCGSGLKAVMLAVAGHQGRRRRVHRRRRAGVDVERAALRLRHARRHQGRQSDDGRRDDPRRPLGLVRLLPHGRVRRVHRGEGGGQPAGSGRVRRTTATGRRWPPQEAGKFKAEILPVQMPGKGGPADRRRRRVAPQGHQPGDARQAQAGVPEGRRDA